MEHEEIESLLGAFALDAVDDAERAEIEAHLLTCPRCRAEVAAHREIASLLGNSGADAPEGLWTRISDVIAPERPEIESETERLLARLPIDRARSKGRKSFLVSGGLVAVAAAAVVIALLGVQVAHLHRQVQTGALGPNGITAAVNSTLAHTHQTVLLRSAHSSASATVAVAPDDTAYWLSSDLKVLPKTKTYQLWTIVHGGIVSLGVLGPNPNRYSAFRLQPNMRMLMVSVEPEGGVPAPTTPVLISATI